MKTLLKAVAVALVSLTLFGCGGLDYVLMKTTQLFQGPPMTVPKFSLEGRNVVILVDAGNQDLLEQQPQMRYKMARIVAAELESKHAAQTIVSPREVVTATQADPDFSNRSTVEIGKRFKADTVLHIVVRTYAIRPTTGTDTFSGRIDIGLRVIDVTEARQVFPGLERFHFVDVRSPTGISADSAVRAEDKLLEGLALKVGQVFVEYEVDSLPRTNEVK
jgi:hypothetical protein